MRNVRFVVVVTSVRFVVVVTSVRFVVVVTSVRFVVVVTSVRFFVVVTSVRFFVVVTSVRFVVVVTRCDQGYLPYKEHCYKFSTEIKSWSDAQKACDNEKSKLVSIGDSLEQEFINSTF